MKRWRWFQFASLVIGIIGITVIAGMTAALLHDSAWGIVLAAGLAIVIGVAWRIHHGATLQLQKAAWEEETIRLWSHHRHDWMNDVQVLYGYIRLNKYDRLSGFMDKIRTKSLQDGFLAKLGIPSLVVYLLQGRTSGAACSVEIEIEEELDLRTLELSPEEVDLLVRRIVGRFMEMCGSGSSTGQMGTLSIGFNRDEGELLLDFVYNGPVDRLSLESELEFVQKRWPQQVRLRENQIEEDQAELAMALSFRA